MKSTKTWYQRERRRRITRLLARDGECCYLCTEKLDRKIDDPKAAHFITFDHVTPRALGGLDAETNLRLAHRLCNQTKGADMLIEQL